MAKISVVVPIYNVEKYLNRCVDSILNQTFTDFELILVDDGSPDNCGKICDEYAEKDNRVRVIHKPNGGLSDARNAGIEWALKNSDSEWITFIDSDDWIHPEFLEFLLNAALENNTDVNICEVFDTKKEIEFPEITFKAEVWSTKDFWIKHHGLSIISVAKLIKKNSFMLLRFPVGKIHEDEFTTYKILFEYSNISYVPCRLYYYYFNPESITKSQWTPKRLAVLEAVDNQLKFFSENNINELVNYTLRKKAVTISCQINYLNKLQDKKIKRQYLRSLRKHLRKHLRNYKKEIAITFKEDTWIYECAYPVRMWLYWAVKAQINKIKK